MPDPIRLDLVVCQTQDSVGVAHMIDPRRLDLAINQPQDNVGLACMPGPKSLDLIVSQVQDNYHTLIACPREWLTFIGSNLGEELSLIGLATLDVLNSNLPTPF